MKILYIGKYYEPYLGGIETVTKDLCVEMSRRGHEVVGMVAHEANFRKRVDSSSNFQIIKLRRYGRLISVPICFWNARQINSLQPDIVHIHLPNPLPLFVVKNIKAPVVVTYHASIVNKGLVGHLYSFIYRHQLKHVNLVALTSGLTKKEKNFKKLNIPNKKLVTVPIGIDDLAVKFSLSKKSSSSSFRFIFSGRLVKYKGLDYMIRAMASITANLDIVGAGPEGRRLKKLVAKLGLGHKVNFWGRLDQKTLFTKISESDLFVLPSLHEAEAFGVSALEAMSLGCPVLTTRLNSGVVDINHHGKTGIVVSPGSVESIVEGIHLFFGKKILLKMGQEAQHRFAKNFCKKHMVESYLDCYSRCRKV